MNRGRHRRRARKYQAQGAFPVTKRFGFIEETTVEGHATVDSKLLILSYQDWTTIGADNALEWAGARTPCTAIRYLATTYYTQPCAVWN